MLICDSMPYYNLRFSGLPFLWTFLLNLALFAAVSAIVFIVAGEFSAYTNWRKTTPYCVWTVALGVLVDLVFLYMVVFQYDDFVDILFRGELVVQDVTLLILSSMITFILLWVVQMFLIPMVDREIVLGKRMIMAAAISFFTLPTWGTLVILALNGITVLQPERYV